MIIEKLNWDSEFFGLKIGKVTIIRESEFDWRAFKEEACNEKFELIYVFKLRKMLSWKTVQETQLDLVDIQLTMERKFNKDDVQIISYDFRTHLTSDEKQDCYGIAEETAVVSRFYQEDKIGPVKTKQLYRKWIDNALNKSFSDGLFVNKEANSVNGIHLIKTDRLNKIGYFTLTGVDPNYKRMGIGDKLWMQSFAYWANESEIESVKSPFSFQNSESFHFHIKNGFKRIVETKFIYHLRNTV